MLNNRFLPFLVLCLSLFACKKDAKESPTSLSSSSWRATDYWQGIGSADDGWHHLSDVSYTLVFDKKGKGIEYSNGVPNSGYYYQVTGDSTMDQKGDSVTQTGHEYFFIRNDTLEIWGIGCMEGCGTRYVQNLTD